MMACGGASDLGACVRVGAQVGPRSRNERSTQTEQSCPWVGLTHGFGWVGSTIAKVLKF